MLFLQNKSRHQMADGKCFSSSRTRFNDGETRFDLGLDGIKRIHLFFEFFHAASGRLIASAQCINSLVSAKGSESRQASMAAGESPSPSGWESPQPAFDQTCRASPKSPGGVFFFPKRISEVSGAKRSGRC